MNFVERPPTFEEIIEFMNHENSKYGEDFQEVTTGHLGFYKKNMKKPPFRVMRNRDFLCQLFREEHGVVRITVNRTVAVGYNERLGGPEWADGITWDQLQAIKTALGYGHRSGRFERRVLKLVVDPPHEKRETKNARQCADEAGP